MELSQGRGLQENIQCSCLPEPESWVGLPNRKSLSYSPGQLMPKSKDEGCENQLLKNSPTVE